MQLEHNWYVKSFGLNLDAKIGRTERTSLIRAKKHLTRTVRRTLTTVVLF